MSGESSIRQNPVDLKKFYQNIMKKSPLLYGHQFIVEFSGPDLPGRVQSGTDYTSITYYVKSTSIPEVNIEEQKIAFLSQEFVVPKQVSYGGEWSVNVLVDQNMTHYRSLYDWQNSFARLEYSGGGLKTIPNVTAHVGLLDASLQNVIHRFTLEGVFPTKIPDLSMQYENQASPVEFSCTFTYQYLYDAADGDPLASSAKASK